MKKLLGILVLSLLWCNNLSAKIIEINKCYFITSTRDKTIQYNSWKEWNSSHKWGWKKYELYIKQSPKPYEDVIYRIDTETGTVKQLWILTDVAVQNGNQYLRELKELKYKIDKGILKDDISYEVKILIDRVNSTKRIRTRTKNISDYFDKTVVILDPESQPIFTKF